MTKVTVKVDGFEVSYEGEYPTAGLLDMLGFVQGLLYDGDTETWIVGDPALALFEHYNLTTNKLLGLAELEDGSLSYYLTEAPATL